ncbi:T9SS type B sorting domain-containing protein [Polaribacter haliotis]|uniref:T9SS type B sorting domain-containing protein n=1 Tax=Polaribacter haliotis TaxID=1888915 RepID=A0A7L8ABX1_9FLAO|nr:T9SS type B sorting domain-containing protein [Polaribacter haliotis]QOD59482.1 T9SS type B sorting domain-containing protein [Polaribacter haliotis]
MSVLFYAQTDTAPVITANGDQAFCIGNAINIVEDFTITDSDDTGIEFFFIQISSGYQNGFDLLDLGSHSTIDQSWNSNEGKLTLFSKVSGTEMLFSDLEEAVKQVTFTTTANTVSEEKIFSLTADDKNYLKETDHFYEFIPAQGITWKDAKIAAENKFYYGRRGYLATLTSEVEADFAGKQASGAGWIGGSDEETEGVWKWVTGPEAGDIFWNGQVNGSSPQGQYAKWNRSEPNDFRGNNTTGEDYAHITDPSIGIRGAWNDLPNVGGTNLYVPRGYVVEYGSLGDPPLNIAATSRIYIPQIITITEANVCEAGTATISAIPSEGQILGYTAASGGDLLFIGNNFTTTVSETTTFYASVSVDGCISLPRTPIRIIVNQRPNITNTENDLICSGTALLSATASEGVVNWYDSLTGGELIHIGNTYRTPVLTATVSYFVEANNSNCISLNRTEVIAEVDTTIPVFNVEKENVALCKDIGSVDLKVIDEQGIYTYVWKKEGVLIAGNTSEINISEVGNYSVKAFSEAGCESLEKTIVVKESEIANITKEDILIIDDSDNNSINVEIQNIGSGNYEFTLDNEFGNYKDNGFFEGISTGLHTLFIRDKGGCGTAKYTFSILEYPRFFTPNNDTKNDFWNLKGYNKDFYTVTDIYIYNRYGVVLSKITQESEGWDGTYKGKLLPSNSYWFQAILTDKNGLSVEKKGSFSLIRK